MKLDENGKIYVKKYSRPFSKKKWYWLIAKASGEDNITRAEKYWNAFMLALNNELADNAICNIPEFGKFVCSFKKTNPNAKDKTPKVRVKFVQAPQFCDFTPEEFRMDGNMEKARAVYEKQGVEEDFDNYLLARGTENEVALLIQAQKKLLRKQRIERQEKKAPKLKESEENIEELSE